MVNRRSNYKSYKINSDWKSDWIWTMLVTSNSTATPLKSIDLLHYFCSNEHSLSNSRWLLSIIPIQRNIKNIRMNSESKSLFTIIQRKVLKHHLWVKMLIVSLIVGYSESQINCVLFNFGFNFILFSSVFIF